MFHQVVLCSALFLLLQVVFLPTAAGFNEGMESWHEGGSNWDWTLRPPDPTEASQLTGLNICTKQEA